MKLKLESLTANSTSVVCGPNNRVLAAPFAPGDSNQIRGLALTEWGASGRAHGLEAGQFLPPNKASLTQPPCHPLSARLATVPGSNGLNSSPKVDALFASRPLNEEPLKFENLGDRSGRGLRPNREAVQRLLGTNDVFVKAVRVTGNSVIELPNRVEGALLTHYQEHLESKPTLQLEFPANVDLPRDAALLQSRRALTEIRALELPHHMTEGLENVFDDLTGSASKQNHLLAAVFKPESVAHFNLEVGSGDLSNVTGKLPEGSKALTAILINLGANIPMGDTALRTLGTDRRRVRFDVEDNDSTAVRPGDVRSLYRIEHSPEELRVMFNPKLFDPEQMVYFSGATKGSWDSDVEGRPKYVRQIGLEAMRVAAHAAYDALEVLGLPLPEGAPSAVARSRLDRTVQALEQQAAVYVVPRQYVSEPINPAGTLRDDLTNVMRIAEQLDNMISEANPEARALLQKTILETIPSLKAHFRGPDVQNLDLSGPSTLDEVKFGYDDGPDSFLYFLGGLRAHLQQFGLSTPESPK